MCKKLVPTLLLLLTLLNTELLYAQDYEFRRNDRAAVASGQPNGAPLQAGTTEYREVYTTDKPGLNACSAANTGTSAVNILAGAANISHVVYKVNCSNNTTVASLITFKQNTTTVGIDYIGTTTLGTNRIEYRFPKPVYVDGAKPLTFTMTTNSTSTICCANYLDYPNTTPTPTATPTATPTP